MHFYAVKILRSLSFPSAQLNSFRQESALFLLPLWMNDVPIFLAGPLQQSYFCVPEDIGIHVYSLSHFLHCMRDKSGHPMTSKPEIYNSHVFFHWDHKLNLGLVFFSFLILRGYFWIYQRGGLRVLFPILVFCHIFVHLN